MKLYTIVSVATDQVSQPAAYEVNALGVFTCPREAYLAAQNWALGEWHEMERDTRSMVERNKGGANYSALMTGRVGMQDDIPIRVLIKVCTSENWQNRVVIGTAIGRKED